MRVTVRQPAGTSLFFELPIDNTFSKLAGLIEGSEGIPAKLQLFKVNGTTVSHDNLLSHHAPNEENLEVNVLYSLDGGVQGCVCESKDMECACNVCCCESSCVKKFDIACCCVRCGCCIM